MKEKTLKLTDYFELRKPTYLYIKITPHKSIRNYTSNNIAKAISHTYRSINKRIYKEQKRLIIETNFKISYVIDIEGNNSSFYFIVPKPFLNIILEKIKEIWSKATVEVLENGIKPFSPTSEMYGVSYKKEDAMSLLVDRKSNEPLNSILNVMEIMKDEDRITIVYNFMPTSQQSWLERYETTMKKITEKKSIDKKVFSFDYILRNSAIGLLSVLDACMGVINDFVGNNSEVTQESLYTSILGVLERQGELSPSTKKKRDATILPTQIAIISDSMDDTRKENNALSVCQSYRVLDEDNELIYKKAKSVPNILSYDMGTDINTMSCSEIGSFIQIPGRMLLQQFKINHINIEENNVPENLRSGDKRLGVVSYKGNKIDSYLDSDWDLGNCSLNCVGGQGSGKSTFIVNYAKDSIKANEGLIVIDFIKNCELSESIAEVTPADKLVKINLAKEETIQAFSYNEMKITPEMTIFKKLDLASMQSEQMMSLIDAISIGEPLSSGMRRVFNAACIVVSIQGYSSLKSTIECLESHEKRDFYISNLNSELKIELDEELKSLEELNEYDKKTGEIVGTRTSKISFILDRVDLLRSNFKLKYMYKADPNNNIDLKECMIKNKVVLIQMRDGDFPTKMQKNLLVTYWITKIWLASQLRGMETDKPSRCNMIIDEVFQAPTSLNILEYILVQARKFSLKPVLSMHYIKQLEQIFEALLTSNGSFMLMKGCTENDYNNFKNKIEGFEYEDLKDMKRYHSLNLICQGDCYSSFITKLPMPI